MAKLDRKKNKLAVPESGAGAGADAASVLRHNPFAALTVGTTLPASTAATTEPVAEAERGPTKKTRARLILRREKKQRGGKIVVVVAGLRAQAHLAESEIAKLAQHLKQQLGCGGSVERVAGDSELVLQGDQPARVAELLRESGFRVDGVTS